LQADVDTTVRKRLTGGHYSPSVRAGDFVFVAGQVPRDAERRVVGVTIEEQTAATIENLRAVLEEAGATLSQVVKATVHLADLSDAPRFDATYARYFPDHPPVRTTVGSVLNGVLVEIDVIAFVGTATSRTEREA
jgi:2-iminobutanoate/2-iminopropanoate deaminase